MVVSVPIELNKDHSQVLELAQVPCLPSALPCPGFAIWLRGIVVVFILFARVLLQGKGFITITQGTQALSWTEERIRKVVVRPFLQLCLRRLSLRLPIPVSPETVDPQTLVCGRACFLYAQDVLMQEGMVWVDLQAKETQYWFPSLVIHHDE